mmetsp:Transcript_10007/g.27681  ORF Transcript_10007/g.27681 Transcript_10007/m.27681 type:complete len:290 (+) Transcript_10007:429-1298(+)
MDTLLDETIIAKCNELLQLKQRTVRTRVQRQNERAHTQRALERAKRDLDGRQQQLRFTKDLSRYQQALRDDDNDDDDTKVMPPLAAARQSQLCLHVHVMTVLENQLELLRQQHRDELLRLEQQVKLHREGIAETEVQVLNDMVAVQQEIRDFVEWTQEPLVKRKQQKKQQRQKQLEREQKKKQEEEEEDMPTSPAKEEEEDDDNQPNAVGSPSTKPKKVRFRSTTTTPPHRRQSTGGLLPNDNNNDENRSALLGERQTSAPKLSQSSEGLKRMMMPSRPSSLTKISMIH